ncbi:phosphopantothenoylcysteine decarboxylase [Novymonas esmeraldas]|uniref:Phosphopantothenoylcysteine decarboxylase n=1 Tax=Novymonas esmeraldas TaxID=1808958 RepID=A0AAW0ELV6_9TRYP
MPSPEAPATPLPSEEEYPSVHLLLLITGSVAAVKTGLLLDQLSTERCKIRIAATKAAFHFLRRAQPSKTGIPFQSIITDEQEWSEWQAMNDSVVHIELRRWADLVVIAPLNANTLAKVATGLCDNLVSSVMRAWEVREKPVIVCPAMNTAMWMHPITAKQLDQLAEWYGEPDTRGGHSCAEVIQASLPARPDGEPSTAATTNGSAGSVAAPPLPPPPPPLPSTLRQCMCQVVGPVSKRLACGDIGVGGMASVEEIAHHIRHTMELIRLDKRQRNGGARENAAAAAVAAPCTTDPAKPPLPPPLAALATPATAAAAAAAHHVDPSSPSPSSATAATTSQTQPTTKAKATKGAAPPKKTKAK